MTSFIYLNKSADVGSFATFAKCTSSDKAIQAANAFFTLSITEILLDNS